MELGKKKTEDDPSGDKKPVDKMHGHVVCRVSRTVQVHVLAVRSRQSSQGTPKGASDATWVREAKPAETVSPHRATVDPTGQVPSELRAETCKAGLCPPEGSSSLTSAV
ncbi:UNVERIFIED_CONTAM: hypothetical protein FKN15_029894 [Acipenser sinensis]